MFIPTQPTTQGDLPSFVFPADHELPLAGDIEVGQIVAFHSRGRYRAAKVVKVTAKRVTAIYTTMGARETAENIAAIHNEARVLAGRKHDLENTARYGAMADMIERLEIEVTEGRKPPDSPFVKIASLPAEYQRLEMEGGGTNGARTTIVWKPETLRAWATAGTPEALAKHEAALAAAREEDAKPLMERIVKATHVTTKIVGRGQVFAVDVEPEPLEDHAGSTDDGWEERILDAENAAAEVVDYSGEL